jgi:hypothetical protein
MSDQNDDNEPVSLGDFVDPDYPEYKRRILEHGLRCLIRVYRQRDWDYWEGVVDAAKIIAEEVCTKYKLDLPTVDTAKGSLFQSAFLPRWQNYERRTKRNDEISSGERSFVVYLVKNPVALQWRKGQPPHKQRRMIHPSNVVSGYKAALREKHAETKPSPKDRLIGELDQRIDTDAKTIGDLKRRLDDHEWDHRDEVSELIATLTTKLRNHGVADQVFVIEEMLRGLGWSGPTLDAINRIVVQGGEAARHRGDETCSEATQGRRAGTGSRGLVTA